MKIPPIKERGTEAMKIVAAVDDNLYYHYLAKGLYLSLQKNSRLNQLDFFLLYSGSKPRLFDQELIEMIRVDPLPVQCGVIRSSATYCRLEIPSLSEFDDAEFVVYMDVDMMCIGDLRPLEKVKPTTIAMYHPGDRCRIKEFLWRVFKIKLKPISYRVNNKTHIVGVEDHNYYNAGLMILNLPYWRENEVATHIKAIITQNCDKMITSDEMAINLYFKGKATKLARKFNWIEEPDFKKARLLHFNTTAPILDRELRTYSHWIALFSRNEQMILQKMQKLRDKAGRDAVRFLKASRSSILSS